MANLNNMFNSDDSMAFTITLLMTTKYITLNKGGNLSDSVIGSVLSNKFSDLVRDGFLTSMIIALQGFPSKSCMIKIGVYFATLYCCICSIELISLTSMALLLLQKRRLCSIQKRNCIIDQLYVCHQIQKYWNKRQS